MAPLQRLEGLLQLLFLSIHLLAVHSLINSLVTSPSLVQRDILQVAFQQEPGILQGTGGANELEASLLQACSRQLSLAPELLTRHLRL